MNVTQIFSGRVPLYDINKDGAIVLAIMNGQQLSRPGGLEDSVWKLIVSCCQMEPEKRPTASQVLETLRSIRPELDVNQSTPPSDWDEGFITHLRSLANYPDLSGANVWE
jgi:hypothetical protein